MIDGCAGDDWSDDLRNRAIRLILTDIDGTILPYGTSEVSARMRAAFHTALDAGIEVGPASGRGFSHIPASFGGDAACCATCLATNGMQVYLRGELVHEERIPEAPVRRLSELLRDIPHAGLICFEDGVPLLAVGERGDLRRSFPTYARECVAVDQVPSHPLEKVNVFVDGNLEATRSVLEVLRKNEDGVDLNLPMPGFLNVTPVGWSKACGIDVLAGRLGIGLDQVAVFGDGGNDVEMLEHVPASFAVQGASPEASRAASYRIGPCEQDAVAGVIEALAGRGKGASPYG